MIVLSPVPEPSVNAVETRRFNPPMLPRIFVGVRFPEAF